MAGVSQITRFEFTQKIAERFDLNKELIKPILSTELNQQAKRPKDSTLCLDKLAKEAILTKNIQESLDSIPLP